MKFRSVLLLVLTFVLTACGGGGDGGSSISSSVLLRWNQIAIDASGRDHTAAGAHEQTGPTRSSRAMAIVHLAMFDAINAINAIDRRYSSYLPTEPVSVPTSVNAAIAQAAHDTLIPLFPAQAAIFADALGEDLRAIRDGAEKSAGIALGERTARAILDVRSNDGSSASGNYHTSNEPGRWRPDPINPGQQPHGAVWKRVIPFALASASQFRVPPPPALNSAEYATAFDEVKRLGGDGQTTATERTEDQTVAGIYWAYDGTPTLCAPPRLYNQIAVQIGQEQGLDTVDLGRLLALVNIAMADAGIAIWESKYHYDFWRPVTGIREADSGTGPTGKGDGNALTIGDPNFTPLGAPASNTAGLNFTPPFPAYPSGHAGFGGALFQTLRNVLGRDDIAFTFISDEFNGVTTDVAGAVRPRTPRSFASFSQAEEENGQSRIYLGIHWNFDKTAGIAQGRQIGDYVVQNLLRPLQ